MELLSLKNVSKIYGNRQFRLENISLSVNEGDFCAIIGNRYAGKTPLMQILSGSKFQDSGSVSIFERESRQLDEAALKRISYIPDDIIYYEHRTVRRLFERTASWKGSGSLKRAEELCDIFGIDMNRQILKLTKLQNKCVSFINAVFTDPGLLLVDELYHGLDEETYLKMLDILGRLRDDGAAVVFTCDEYDKISGYCNMYMLLNEGDCIACGQVAYDYVPPQLVYFDFERCFKNTVKDYEREEYEQLFLKECNSLENADITLQGRKLYIIYSGDLTSLSYLLYKYGCEAYVVDQMTFEESVNKDFSRWNR